jgi:hypothetical protein
LDTQTLVHAVLLGTIAFTIGAIVVAALAYMRHRVSSDGTRRRSILLFSIANLTAGIALGYLANEQLPFVACDAFGGYVAGGAMCALSVYVAAPLGFGMGLLVCSFWWSLNGVRSNSTPHTDARASAALDQSPSARAGGRTLDGSIH